METRGALFDELRAALRLTEKAYAHPDKPRTSEQQIAELRDAEAALAALRQSLLDGRPERGPAHDLRDAIDEILEHLVRHGTPTCGGTASCCPTAESSSSIARTTCWKLSSTG